MRRSSSGFYGTRLSIVQTVGERQPIVPTFRKSPDQWCSSSSLSSSIHPPTTSTTIMHPPRQYQLLRSQTILLLLGSISALSLILFLFYAITDLTALMSLILMVSLMGALQYLLPMAISFVRALYETIGDGITTWTLHDVLHTRSSVAKATDRVYPSIYTYLLGIGTSCWLLGGSSVMENVLRTDDTSILIYEGSSTILLTIRIWSLAGTNNGDDASSASGF